jgi:hypothetical protein
MKGDFSRWLHSSEDNFSGVLHQQGRVLLDSDWNAQTQITNDWQDKAARDAFGPGVAAVPAEERDSFKVMKAEALINGQVKVTLSPGRIWADGLLVHLKEELTSYLYPPKTFKSDSDDKAAVILEVWREEINGFQMPDELIEPALGGPDTTERVHTAFDLKLLRLGPDGDCENIREALKDDFSKKGNLTVTLEPSGRSDDECPQSEKGGYTGFEHCLYRIEIAKVDNDDDSPYFKYSKFNGGLVGRGDFQSGSGEDPTITITGNIQAITSLERDSFYMEIIGKVNEQYWDVIFGAEVTLDEEILKVREGRLYHKKPWGNVFFRLWDGIEKVTDYINEKELCDGINLKFNQPNDGAIYLPGDYWTFSVRAGEIGNTSPLIQDQPPEGIHFHRVPLAILQWGKSLSISDCRRIFGPLTSKRSCCRYTVGEGGDYSTIEEALERIADKTRWRGILGGEICLLPGIHLTDAIISGMTNLTIRGCGLKTWVLSRSKNAGVPLFRIADSKVVTLENMTLSKPGGTAIEVEGCQHVEIKDCYILAYKHAIDVGSTATGQGLSERVPSWVSIHNNKIFMLDRFGGDTAISIYAYDSSIDGNMVIVIPAKAATADRGAIGDVGSEELIDECIENAETIDPQVQVAYLNYCFMQSSSDSSKIINPFRAHGGIQIASGCERVKVSHNFIRGGWGNGITLGSYLETDSISDGSSAGGKIKVEKNSNNVWLKLKGLEDDESITLKVTPVEGGVGTGIQFNGPDSYRKFSAENQNYEATIIGKEYKIKSYQKVIAAAGVSYEITAERVEWEKEHSDILANIYGIRIEENEISYMGLSGIGTPQKNIFTALSTSDDDLIKYIAGYGVLSGIVEDLAICNNDIHECLRNIFDISNDTLLSKSMRNLVMLRGEGGISLGLCENLSICENRIRSNGRDHRDPVCGIFISAASQVDISRNKISDNGPIDVTIAGEAILDLHPGFRGGLVLKQVISTPMNIDMSQLAPNRDSPLRPVIEFISALGGYAAQIHENVIRQPAGHALIMNVLGPVSVLNNQFRTDITINANQVTGPLLGWIAGCAGVVFITDWGGEAPLDGLMSGKSNLSLLDFTKGNIMFSNNQIRLGGGLTSFSQFIATKDDLEFHANYSATGEILRANTMLMACYLQAANNRFRENLAPLER